MVPLPVDLPSLVIEPVAEICLPTHPELASLVLKETIS